MGGIGAGARVTKGSLLCKNRDLESRMDEVEAEVRILKEQIRRCEYNVQQIQQ